MILLVAVIAGVLVGLGWASRHQLKYEAPALQYLWLVPVAFLLQSLNSSVILLNLSQALFIGFAFLNRRYFGMKILMVGALLNLLVMVANSGFMPISPQTASRLVSQEILLDFSTGDRFGQKDILLLPEQIRLEWLADRFLPPAWFSYQVAFSLGDVFIAAGAFYLLAKQKNTKDITYDRSSHIPTFS